MELKVIRSRVLELFKMRYSGEGNSGGGVKRKVTFLGKRRVESERKERSSARNNKIVWLGRNYRKPERLGRHIGSQS